MQLTLGTPGQTVNDVSLVQPVTESADQRCRQKSTSAASWNNSTKAKCQCYNTTIVTDRHGTRRVDSSCWLQSGTCRNHRWMQPGASDSDDRCHRYQSAACYHEADRSLQQFLTLQLHQHHTTTATDTNQQYVTTRLTDHSNNSWHYNYTSITRPLPPIPISSMLPRGWRITPTILDTTITSPFASFDDAVTVSGHDTLFELMSNSTILC